MIFAWLMVALAALGGGAWVQDHWPRSIVARCVALAGAAWFAGVWLSLYLTG